MQAVSAPAVSFYRAPVEAVSIRVSDGMVERSVDIADVAGAAGARDASAVFPGRRGIAVPVASIMSTDLPWVTVASADGAYRASIPSATLLEGGRLIVGTSDAPLSEDEGGPIRLLVADGETLCWNVKDVDSLVATETRQPDSVPDDPPH